MIDTYLKSKNKDALLELQASVMNMIPVQQGRAALEAEVDGVAISVPAAGDPEYYYTCVRAAFPVPAFGEVELCDEETGTAVVGVWA